MRKEFSACAIQIFNGYELLSNHLDYVERKDFIPRDIVYEPTLDTKKTILCFYAPNIYLGFHTTVEKFKNGEKVRNHTGARQCHYCNNHFVKSAEKMKKHLSCCARKAGFLFLFFFLTKEKLLIIKAIAKTWEMFPSAYTMTLKQAV